MAHPKYGYGVVRQIRHKGFELKVEFENGLILWIRHDELSLVSPMLFKVGDWVTHRTFGKGRVISIEPYVYQGKDTFKVRVDFEEVGLKTLVQSIAKLEKISKKTSTLPDIVSLPSKDSKFKSRRMLEAFRLGIVPYDCVGEFTFGRDEEVRKITKWLDASKESTMLIIGEYGTGKTHLLHYAIGHAIQKGFAVAWVEMDPNEAPFYKPKRVYSRLVQNFKYRSTQDGQLKGFRSFLKEVLAKGAFKDHLYFKYLDERFLEFLEEEIVWEWIEGKETIPRPVEWVETNWGYMKNRYKFLPGLYDYSTAANIYCYLLSGLGWAAREVLGLKGLLLVFDEAETVEMYYYSYHLERSRNFLKALICTANGDRKLSKSPFESGLVYCRVGIGPNIPFLYRTSSGLKLLFAFTHVDWNYEYYQARIKEIDTAPKINLKPLTDSALKEVFGHICLFYDSAYDFLEEDVTINTIFQQVSSESGRTRLFIKGSVEALDIIRLNKVKTSDRVSQ